MYNDIYISEFGSGNFKDPDDLQNLTLLMEYPQ